MLHQVKGIVFKSVKYSETSAICTVYTDKFGLQSYMINGVRGTRSKNLQALVRPLSILQMTVYHRENKNLQRIREIGFDHIYTALPFDIAKSSVGLLIVEVLTKTIKEQESNQPLFDFIYHQLIYLDEYKGSVANFHLFFLVNLSSYLGFAPGSNFSPTQTFFDLKGGNFCASTPDNHFYIELPDSEWLYRVMMLVAFDDNAIKMPAPVRKRLLRKLITYYELHVESFGRVRSVEILEQVLSSNLNKPGLKGRG